VQSRDSNVGVGHADGGFDNQVHLVDHSQCDADRVAAGLGHRQELAGVEFALSVGSIKKITISDIAVGAIGNIPAVETVRQWTDFAEGESVVEDIVVGVIADSAGCEVGTGGTAGESAVLADRGEGVVEEVVRKRIAVLAGTSTLVVVCAAVACEAGE